MINIIPSLMSAANTELRLAYDSLYRAFDHMQKEYGSEAFIRMVETTPELQDAIKTPSLHALGLMVKTGLVSVPDAIDVVLKLKRAELEQRATYEAYRKSVLENEKLKQEITATKIAALKDIYGIQETQATIAKTKQEAYTAKHNEIKSRFDTLRETLAKTFQVSMSNQSLAALASEDIQKSYQEAFGLINALEQRAHIYLDANPDLPASIAATDVLFDKSVMDSVLQSYTRDDLMAMSKAIRTVLPRLAAAIEQTSQSPSMSKELEDLNFLSTTLSAFNIMGMYATDKRLQEAESLMKHLKRYQEGE